MSLEIDTVANQTEGPAAPSDRRASSERRGKERRKPGGRVNRVAPRRSILQVAGATAVGVFIATVALIFLIGELVQGSVLWIPLGLSLVGLAVALVALMLGCIEQRLIEIRLELMMANGGARQADRRQTDRRAVTPG